MLIISSSKVVFNKLPNFFKATQLLPTARQLQLLLMQLLLLLPLGNLQLNHITFSEVIVQRLAVLAPKNA